jgi:hypothetical protein
VVVAIIANRALQRCLPSDVPAVLRALGAMITGLLTPLSMVIRALVGPGVPARMPAANERAEPTLAGENQCEQPRLEEAQ